MSGIKVIYDVHEDLPNQIKSKTYIPALLRTIVSYAASVVENMAGRVFDGIVPAALNYADRFPVDKTVVLRITHY